MNILRGFLVMVVLMAIASGFAWTQSSIVRWSAIDAGFGSPQISGTRLASILGQSFVGSVRAGNGSIQAGFLEGIVHPPGSSSVGGHGNVDVPLTTTLFQNYPNPFNPSTTIKYTVSGTGGSGIGNRKTMLVVYDVLGRQVVTLVNEAKGPGSYEVKFDASALASGVYIYRLTAASYVQSRKMLVLK